MYPYSIVTLGKYVYWTDMYKRAVLVAKKGNAKQKSIVEDQLLNPYDIGAFDKGRQPGEVYVYRSHSCLLHMFSFN